MQIVKTVRSPIALCRTPRGIGKHDKGALAGIHPQQLAATVLKALAERTGIDTADVDDIVWGCSAQVATQGGDLGLGTGDRVAKLLHLGQ